MGMRSLRLDYKIPKRYDYSCNRTKRIERYVRCIRSSELHIITKAAIFMF